MNLYSVISIKVNTDELIHTYPSKPVRKGNAGVVIE